MPKPLLPDAFIDLQDGRLGLAPAVADGAHAKVGVSTLGAPGAVLTITSVDDVAAKLGRGPLAEACAKSARMGNLPVYAVPAQASVPGSVGAVTKTGGGTSDLAVAGNPRDDLEVVVRVTRPAANLAANTAAVAVSLDGGDTWGQETAVPVSGVLNALQAETGLTLTFSAGSFVEGATHAFAATGPAMNAGDMQAAVGAALSSPYGFEGVHLVGVASGAVAVAFFALIDGAASAFRYLFGVAEARTPAPGETIDAWKAALQTEFAALSSKRAVVVSAFGEVVSQLTGRQERRNLAANAVAWALLGSVSQSVGEVARGGVGGGIVSLGHDEYKSPGLDAAGFLTLRTITDLKGFYVTQGRTFAGPTSDLQYLENLRTVNKMSRLARLAALRFAQARVRVTEDGLLDPRDLEVIQSYIRNPLEAMVAEGDLSAVQVLIDPAQNVLSTRTIVVDVNGVPVGVAAWVGVRLGFLNPRLRVPAAA